MKVFRTTRGMPPGQKQKPAGEEPERNPAGSEAEPETIEPDQNKKHRRNRDRSCQVYHLREPRHRARVTVDDFARATDKAGYAVKWLAAHQPARQAGCTETENQ